MVRSTGNPSSIHEHTLFALQMLIAGYDELESDEEMEVTKKKDKDAKYRWNHGCK